MFVTIFGPKTAFLDFAAKRTLILSGNWELQLVCLLS